MSQSEIEKDFVMQAIEITDVWDVLVRTWTEYYWVKITHDWFDYNDIKQKYVQYAYKLWWFEFVRMIECENGNWNIHAVWDWWDAYWLCQMNKKFHKDIPQAYYDGVWQVQLEYCYQKWKWWTKFYWPSRIVKWMRCSEYVKDRFTFTE